MVRLPDDDGGVLSGDAYLAIMSAIFEADAIGLAVAVCICERNGDSSIFNGLTL